MDPNTLNLDPDPECCPNLDPDPDLGVYYQFKKLREKFFLKTTNFFFFNLIKSKIKNNLIKSKRN